MELCMPYLRCNSQAGMHFFPTAHLCIHGITLPCRVSEASAIIH